MKNHPILLHLEDALARHKISATRFGYIVAGDPALITKLRTGRRPRAAMQSKIAAALVRINREGRL